MNQLQLSLLGPFVVAHNREVVTNFDSNKVRALLIYLAVEGRVHARSTLAALLWPEHDDVNARTNLRQVLYQLRRAIGDDGAIPPFLLVNRQTIGINPAAHCTVDVVTFRQLIAATVTHAHTQLTTCPVCMDCLQQAVELYHDDFLTGFTLDESDTFEEWRRITAEQLHLQVMDVLHQLADIALAQHDLAAAQRYAQRRIRLEPWCEEAHRQMMMAYWQRGQRSAALAQYATCRAILATELGIEPDAVTEALHAQISTSPAQSPAQFPVKRHGDDTVQNVSVPKATALSHAKLPNQMHIFTKGSVPFQPYSTESVSATRSILQITSPTAGLPVQLTPFVGRTAELQAIGELLQQDNVRLITLLGPGGIGKTRLAQQIAQHARATYGEYLYFVPLAGLTDATALATVVATALDLPLQTVDPPYALAHFLADKHALLILDNVEHLLDNTAFIVALLHAAPMLQVLVTSLERLHVAGETIFLVEGMRYSTAIPTMVPITVPITVPTVAPDLPVAKHTAAYFAALAAENSAIQLFIQCAQAVLPSFALSDETLPAVLHICQLVQGMPLALQLAASWVEVLPLSEIAEEIARNADFLESQQRDIPARQQSMRAVFNWSWQLLSEPERQTLRRLSIFRGGFTRAAANAVAAMDVRTLAGLIHKSLLQFHQHPNQHLIGAGRYQIHELLRQFAAEALHLGGEANAIATVHSSYYLTLLAKEGKALNGPDASAAMTRIAQELDNIHQAWAWALQRVDVDCLAESIHALAEYYRIAGHNAQAVQTFGRAADALQTTGTTLNASHAEDLALHSLCSMLLILQADFFIQQSAFEEALGCLEASLPLIYLTGNCWSEANYHLFHGVIRWQQGKSAEALPQLQQALQLVRNQLPHWHGHSLVKIELKTLLWLAYSASVRSDYTTASAYYTEGIALARHKVDQRAEVTFLLNIASLALMRCDWLAATRLYQTALPLTAALGFRWGEASALLEFAYTIRHTGFYQEAISMCERAAAIFVEIHDPHKAFFSLMTCALIYGYLGDFSAATRCSAAAMRSLQETKAHSAQRYHRLVQSTLAWLQGNYLQGITDANAGLEILEGQAGLLSRAHFLLLLGHCEMGLQRNDVANLHYEEAFNAYTTVGLPMLAVEACAGLAAIDHCRGATAAALARVETILCTLAEHPQVGFDEPFRIYLICYQVLTTANDARANALLAQSHALLQEYAARIPDQTLRAAFLNNVATHRAIVEAASGNVDHLSPRRPTHRQRQQ